MSQKRSLTSYQNGSQPPVHPDPEVVPKAKRRSFTAAYKLRILEEAEQCDQSGQTSSSKFCGLRNIEAQLTKKVSKPLSQYASTKV